MIDLFCKTANHSTDVLPLICACVQRRHFAVTRRTCQRHVARAVTLTRVILSVWLHCTHMYVRMRQSLRVRVSLYPFVVSCHRTRGLTYKGLYGGKADGPKIVEIVRDVEANGSLWQCQMAWRKGRLFTYRGDRSVDLTDAKGIALISNGNGQLKFTRFNSLCKLHKDREKKKFGDINTLLKRK